MFHHQIFKSSGIFSPPHSALTRFLAGVTAASGAALGFVSAVVVPSAILNTLALVALRDLRTVAGLH